MDIKNTLQFSYIDCPSQQGKCIRLNMSLRTLFDAVCPNDERLSALGIKFDAPIVASLQDVKDYLELDGMDFEESDNSSDADKMRMRDTYLHKYVAPEYSAFDISTLRFCRNGVWGWVSRKTGEFFTEPIGDRYDVMILACDADVFLNMDDRPDSKQENQYLSIEGIKQLARQRFSEFKRHIKYKLSSIIDLPSLRFKKGLVASPRIITAIRSLALENKGLIISAENNSVPDMRIACSKHGRKNVYRLKWSPKNNALAWHDAKLREIIAFHQLMLPQKETFSLLFYRDFTGRQIHAMVKFIAYYYATIWNVSEEKLVFINAPTGK